MGFYYGYNGEIGLHLTRADENLADDTGNGMEQRHALLRDIIVTLLRENGDGSREIAHFFFVL